MVESGHVVKVNNLKKARDRDWLGGYVSGIESRDRHRVMSALITAENTLENR